MDEQDKHGDDDWYQKWFKKEQEINADTKCTFCGKRRDQVARLTMGPGDVYICNECVDLFREHIDKMPRPPQPGEKTSQTCVACGTIVPTSHHYCYNCGNQF